MPGATRLLRQIFTVGATILRPCLGRAGGILCITLATLLLAGCSSLGKSSHASQNLGGSAQPSPKKYKDPVNEFLGGKARVPFDGVGK